MGQGNVLPGAGVRAPEAYGAVGEVGVGEAQGAFGAVEVDPGLRLGPHVEGGDEGPHGAALEVHHAGHVGRGVYRDSGPREGFAGYHALGECDACRCRNPPHGPHQGRERGQVVGAHIEHRAGAWLEIEVGIRVPVFGAVAEHERRYGDGFAYYPFVHDLAARLEATAEESVGGAADPEVSLSGHLEHPPPILQIHGERLLGVDVLASLQGRQRDLRVDYGDGQVEGDLDLFVGQQFLRCTGLRHTVGFRLGFRPRGHEIRTGNDLDVVERGPVLQIDTTDLAAPDDADFDRPIFADGRSLRSLSTSACQHAQPFGLRLSAFQLLPVHVLLADEALSALLTSFFICSPRACRV